MMTVSMLVWSWTIGFRFKIGPQDIDDSVGMFIFLVGELATGLIVTSWFDEPPDAIERTDVLSVLELVLVTTLGVECTGEPVECGVFAGVRSDPGIESDINGWVAGADVCCSSGDGSGFISF